MKKTILALALVAGLTSFAGSAKADDDFNLMIINDQQGQLSASAQNTIDAINANIASYSLSSLENSFFTYNGAVGQLNADFSNFSNQLNSGYMTFLVGSDTVQMQIDSTSWNNGIYAMVATINNENIKDMFRSNFQQASQNLDSTQSSYQASLQSHYAAVPEPSTYALFGIGAIGMLMVMRRKKTA